MSFYILIILFNLTWLIKSIIYSELFPPNSGVIKADIYLYFAYPLRLPANTIISIQQSFAQWRYTNGHKNNYCWCNFNYISCRFTGQIEIQTSIEIPENQIIEIYLDTSLYLGGTPPGDYPGFSITTSWSGVIITQDLSNSNTVTIKPSVPFATRNWQIAWETITPGTVSNYQFKFTSDCDTNPGDQIVLGFDRKFNPWLCEQKNRNIGDNDYAINCSSDTLGDISCIAKHWFLIVTGVNKTVLSNNNIDVRIKHLWTPLMGQFSVNYYILDSNDNLKSFSDSLAFNINNGIPSALIDFKSVKVSDNHLLNIAKYEFEFYVGNLYLYDYIFFVYFPQEYNLAESPPFTCNVTYFDEASQTPDAEILWFFWNYGSYCTYYNSYAIISIPHQSPKQFTSNMRIKITIDGIKNPQRTYKNTGFENWENINVQDSDYVSGKFQIEIYNPQGTSRSFAESWGVFHSVYAGLNKTNKSFQLASKEGLNIT